VSTAAPIAPSAEPTGFGRRLAWGPAQEAEAYDVEIFRGSERVFAARMTVPRLDLGLTWRHGGRHFALDPGEYDWYVWPVVDGERASSTMVGSTFTVEVP
jgi:hypothetical protein